jgi:hypothetical protein
MGEIIIIIIQVAVEILSSGLGDLLIHSSEKKSESKNGVFSLTLSGLIAGGLIGGLSVFLFPNHYIQSELVRVLMLFVMPLINGIISYLIAVKIRGFRDISIWAHVAFAASFTFMMLAIRLAYGNGVQN